MPAEIVAWMESRAKHGSAADAGILTLQEKLKQWARRAAPPVRQVDSVVRKYGAAEIGGGILVFLFGAVFAVANWRFDSAWNKDSSMDPIGFPANLIWLLGAGIAAIG